MTNQCTSDGSPPNFESTNGSWPAESLDSYQLYSTASVMYDCGSTRKFEVMNSSRPAGFVGKERSVWFSCIRDVSGILDDVAVDSLQRHPGLRTQVPLVGHVSSLRPPVCSMTHSGWST